MEFSLYFDKEKMWVCLLNIDQDDNMKILGKILQNNIFLYRRLILTIRNRNYRVELKLQYQQQQISWLKHIKRHVDDFQQVDTFYVYTFWLNQLEEELRETAQRIQDQFHRPRSPEQRNNRSQGHTSLSSWRPINPQHGQNNQGTEQRNNRSQGHTSLSSWRPINPQHGQNNQEQRNNRSQENPSLSTLWRPIPQYGQYYQEQRNNRSQENPSLSTLWRPIPQYGQYYQVAEQQQQQQQLQLQQQQLQLQQQQHFGVYPSLSTLWHPIYLQHVQFYQEQYFGVYPSTIWVPIYPQYGQNQLALTSSVQYTYGPYWNGQIIQQRL